MNQTTLSPRLLTTALAGLLLVALSACSATPIPSVSRADCTPADADAVIAMSAKDLKFDTPCLIAPADQAFTVRLTNNDAVPHDVAIFRDAAFTDSIVQGDLFTGPNVTQDLDVPALTAGTYYFKCILHPDMKGPVYVE